MVFMCPEVGCLRGQKFAIFVCSFFGSGKLTYFGQKWSMDNPPLYRSPAAAAPKKISLLDDKSHPVIVDTMDPSTSNTAVNAAAAQQPPVVVEIKSIQSYFWSVQVDCLLKICNL